jgi:phosphoribosylanthranilate isomerase
MVKVKICGITNLEDALAAYFSKADAIGFVFYKKSPRYINPKKARNIARILPKDIIKVGVFVDEKEKRIKSIAKMCGLDMLQFHGSESPKFCKRFKGYKIIKAFRIKDKLELAQLGKYNTFALLFDTYSKNRVGGTGKKFNWNLLREKGKIKKVVFLSGGLNTGNINAALKAVNPQWIDVSSSVELRPGKKDHKKIRSFIKKVK